MKLTKKDNYPLKYFRKKAHFSSTLSGFLSTLLFLSVILLNSCSEEPVVKQVDSSNKKYGGVYKINLQEKGVSTMSPLTSYTSSATTAINIGYETLLKYKNELNELEGLLANKWEVNVLGDEYTFYLNENVYFHDDECFENNIGREMTSADVAYCITRLCQPSESNNHSSLLSRSIVGGTTPPASTNNSNTYLEGIEIINDYTLKIKLEEPSQTFIHLLTHFATSIYPKEAVFHYGENWGKHMVSTSPFKLKTYVGGKTVIYVRNNNYWQEDETGNPLPYLDGVKLTYNQDKNAISEAVRSNMLDMILSPSSKMESTIQSTGNYNLNSITTWNMYYLSMMLSDTTFSDIHVRKAINLAIDRQFIRDSIFSGKVNIANYGIIPSSIKEYNTEKGYAYNPTAAIAILKKEGYGISRPKPSITLNISGTGKALILGQAIQKMLTEIGIHVDLSSTDNSQYYKNYVEGKLGFAQINWTADYGDPYDFLSLFISDKTPETGGFNVIQYNNGEYDKLCKKGFKEFDRVARTRHFKEANKILFDESVIVPIYCEEGIFYSSVKTQNVPLIINSRISLTNTYLLD